MRNEAGGLLNSEGEPARTGDRGVAGDRRRGEGAGEAWGGGDSGSFSRVRDSRVVIRKLLIFSFAEQSTVAIVYIYVSPFS